MFCITDDFVNGLIGEGGRLRRRGPRPTVADSVVLTCELVGEFLGYDTDSGIFAYFRRHHGALFPKLLKVHRTTFARQAANLWKVKEHLQEHLQNRIGRDPLISITDSFPIPVCRFARAYRCQRLAPEAAYGHDEMAQQTFYGLRGHVGIEWPGVICTAELAAANTHDVEMAPRVLRKAQGWALGDRNYWSPLLFERLKARELSLLAPFKSRTGSSHEKYNTRWSGRLTRMRRRVETVIGQLVGRFNAKKVWAMDRWHVWSRWMRKVTSHTMAVLLCRQENLPPLRFAELIDD